MAVDEPTKKAPLKAIPDLERIRARIHHHLRTCSAAVKRARTFEVQRTIKKLKTASSDERQELENLLNALKASHHGLIAAIAIQNKLAKAKLLPKGESDDDLKIDKEYPLSHCVEELKSTIGSKLREPESSKIGEKAKAKLLSNKVVSEKVSKVVKELSDLLQGKQISKPERGFKSDNQKKGNEIKPKREPAVDDTDEVKNKFDVAEEADSQSTDSEEERDIADIAMQRFTSIETSEEALPRVSKRPAEKSEDHITERPKKQRRKEEVYNEVSSSDDESVDDEDSSNGYFPALTTGFVGGKGFNLGRDSDDEWSDGDAELESIDEDADGSGKQKQSRKNRMGQRARRAIWEKKFGKGANHVKLREKEAKKRANDGDFGKGKAGQGGKEVPFPLQRDAGWSGALGQVVAPRIVAASKAKVEMEMHPSWIAKQREKEKAEAAAQSRGKAKKIVFD